MSGSLHTVILRLGALVLGVVACACGKTLTLEEPSVLAVSGEPIAFAVEGQTTKGEAPVTTLAALAAQQFSVSAWYSPDGQAFSAAGNTGYMVYSNQRFGYVTDDLAGQTTFPNPWQGVNAPEGGGVTKNPIYWPFSGTLSFFCYAPYRADAALETPPVPDNRDIVLEDPVTDAAIIARLPDYLADSPLIRVTPAASASDQADLLVAPPLLDKSRFYFAGQSQLDFSKHRMAVLPLPPTKRKSRILTRESFLRNPFLTAADAFDLSRTSISTPAADSSSDTFSRYGSRRKDGSRDTSAKSRSSEKRRTPSNMRNCVPP